MNNNDTIIIPEFIDTPPQFLFLEADDLAPFLCGFGVGILLRFFTQNAWGMVVGIFVGIILMHIYIRFKRNTLPGTLHHFLYCFSSLPLNKHFKNGMIKKLNN